MVYKYIIVSDISRGVVESMVNEKLKTGEYHLYGDLQVTVMNKTIGLVTSCYLVYTQVLVRGTI